MVIERQWQSTNKFNDVARELKHIGGNIKYSMTCPSEELGRMML